MEEVERDLWYLEFDGGILFLRKEEDLSGECDSVPLSDTMALDIMALRCYIPEVGIVVKECSCDLN